MKLANIAIRISETYDNAPNIPSSLSSIASSNRAIVPTLHERMSLETRSKVIFLRNLLVAAVKIFPSR